MIAGAIIGNKVNKRTVLVLISALLSHFVLDFIPHFEYILKPLTLFLDLSLGATVAVVLAYKNIRKAKTIVASAFIAIIPDAPAFIRIVSAKLDRPDIFNSFISQLIIAHNYFHTKISFVFPTTMMQGILTVSIILAMIYLIKIINTSSSLSKKYSSL
jgi:voltage-gated potassium channel Kch